MAPPAKRQKRSIIVSSPPSSDDEDCNNGGGTPRLSSFLFSPASKPAPLSEPATPTKPRSKAEVENSPHNASPVRMPSRLQRKKAGTKSASTSPEKAKSKGGAEEKGRSGDIKKLFSTQIQKQKSAANGFSLSKNTEDLCAETQRIEKDVTSDDDDVRESKARMNSIIGAAAKKRARGVTTGDVDIVSASQKFLRKPVPKPDAKQEIDMRPWAERFAPVSLDELAVHKKKVADVRGWLESVMGGQLRQRLLVLKGVAGTGKTTTVQLLANDMGYHILEWRNPVGSVASVDGALSMAAQFEEFLGRGGKFGQLDIFSETSQLPQKPDTEPLDRRKTIILVEEFPNTFTRSSSALHSFRSTVLQYLASNIPALAAIHSKSTNIEAITPLVMVISETLLTTSSASADSFTAHRLLGPEILQHPGVGVIEFNAIAPTLLTKALELVVLKESRKSGRRRTPGPLVLKRLGEIGDVRSAIGSLEFLCVRGDEDGDWGAKVTFTKGKRASKGSVPLTKMEQESLELVTRREATLGIFHAVGKVVYNKRDEVLSSEIDVENLPEYLSEQARPKRSQVAVDELIDETGTDTQTFIAALHENFILSCDANPLCFEFSDLDHVNGCIDSLSDSDLLCPAWDGSFNSTGLGGRIGGRGSGGDILRQDEICFQIAVRGLLFSLPCPVKRRAPAAAGFRQGRSSEAYKMFYPTSMKLWRMKEEIEGIIDLCVTRLMKGGGLPGSGRTTPATIAFQPKPGSVETWQSHRANESSAATPGEKLPEAGPSLAAGISARKEMLLERLPYMALIAKSRRGSLAPLPLKDLERLTTFTGIGPSDEGIDDEEDAAVITEGWATDKPVERESPKKRGRTVKGRGLEERFAEQKLVLSDDDIED